MTSIVRRHRQIAAKPPKIFYIRNSSRILRRKTQNFAPANSEDSGPVFPDFDSGQRRGALHPQVRVTSHA
jgi:hypothetical protein